MTDARVVLSRITTLALVILNAAQQSEGSHTSTKIGIKSDMVISMKTYYVYVLTNYSRTVLYVGITNDLTRRLQEHITDSLVNKKTFAGKYNCTHLLYYEEFRQVNDAIAREKELKGWKRERKLELIKVLNPELKTLALW